MVVITAWDRELWWYVEPSWVKREPKVELLERLEVEVVGHPGDLLLEVRWTEAQARAYMLTDVLVDELGHRHDRMTSPEVPQAPRGEP